jgi:hypothetical protein
MRVGLLRPFATRLFGRRDRDHAAIFDSPLCHDVFSKVLDSLGGPLKRGQLHAIVIVEMDVQRGQREIMMTVEVFDEAPGKVAGRMVVDIDQCRHAIASVYTTRQLLEARPRKVAKYLRAVLVSSFSRCGIDLCQEIIIDCNGHSLHSDESL